MSIDRLDSSHYRVQRRTEVGAEMYHLGIKCARKVTSNTSRKWVYTSSAVDIWGYRRSPFRESHAVWPTTREPSCFLPYSLWVRWMEALVRLQREISRLLVIWELSLKIYKFIADDNVLSECHGVFYEHAPISTQPYITMSIHAATGTWRSTDTFL